MTDLLTDEQLRAYCAGFNNPFVRDMATELLALRARNADLEMALRKSAASGLPSGTGATLEGVFIGRPPSATSGAARKGDLETMDDAERDECVKRTSSCPTPPEAPNMDRARELATPRTAFGMATFAAEIKAALDVARAEGIAAERERIARWFEGKWVEESGPEWGLSSPEERSSWREQNRLVLSYADCIRAGAKP